jgi:hypothetical protein
MAQAGVGAVGHGLPAGDWDDETVAGTRWPRRHVAAVSIGGGLGSFAFADLQRIRGRPVAGLAVVAEDPDPVHAFRWWAENSQVAEADRLRSDSGARIDNPWGWPSYAMSEARRRRTPLPILEAVGEPLFGLGYTPAAGDVYRGVAREARRIGWDGFTVTGRATAVRRRREGGFFVVVGGEGGVAPARSVLSADAVHLAPGHGGPVVPADAAAALELHPEWCDRVVNAYDPHEPVYARLAGEGGTVVVRGGGITAEQVLRRLLDERRRLGVELTVLHAPHRPDSALEHDARLAAVRRPYSAPRAAFGGPVHERLARAERRGGGDELRGEVRRATTPLRRRLRRELSEGRRAGWYRPVLAATVGAGTPPAPGDDGVPVEVEEADGTRHAISAVAVVDCTGLHGPVGCEPLLEDLAGWLPDAGFAVDERFALVGSRHGPGAVYASGALAGNGPVGPVDSFWGLTYAAYVIGDDLARHGIGPSQGPFGSVLAWCRWLAGRAP